MCVNCTIGWCVWCGLWWLWSERERDVTRTQPIVWAAAEKRTGEPSAVDAPRSLGPIRRPSGRATCPRSRCCRPPVVFGGSGRKAVGRSGLRTRAMTTGYVKNTACPPPTATTTPHPQQNWPSWSQITIPHTRRPFKFTYNVQCSFTAKNRKKEKKNLTSRTMFNYISIGRRRDFQKRFFPSPTPQHDYSAGLVPKIKLQRPFFKSR